MKKLRTLYILVLFAFVLYNVPRGTLMKTYAATPEIRVMLDGEYIKTEVPPINEKGRVLIPARAVFEAAGAVVTYAEKDRQIKISLPPYRVTLTLEKTAAYVDGEKYTLDVAAHSVKGRTLVPLRFVGEAVGFEVEYYQNTVIVMTEDAGALTLEDCKDLIDGKPLVIEKLKPGRPSKTEGNITVTTPIRRNNPATVTLRGAANRDYLIHVYYKSGESAAKGLGSKRSDADGNVSWTWRVGAKTASGTYRIMVESVDTKAVHEEFEITFEVVK